MLHCLKTLVQMTCAHFRLSLDKDGCYFVLVTMVDGEQLELSDYTLKCLPDRTIVSLVEMSKSEPNIPSEHVLTFGSFE